MNLHEFQGKEILSGYGVRLPESRVAYHPDEAWMHSMQMGFPCVVKAQVHAGGRGKAGGVKFCRDAEEVKKGASAILGKRLRTAQTGANGIKVRKILVEKGVDIEKEFYFSILLNNTNRCPMIVASAAGGMDIEEVSEKTPEKIIRIDINPYAGLLSFHVRELAEFLGIGHLKEKARDLFEKLYKVFMEKECTLLEINPLMLTRQQDLIPIDVKMDIDDNALFRRREILKMRDLTEQDPDEVEARLSGLNFIKLEGNVGCMVNGAGLAMATMDFVKMAGAEPANFLDVGGVATPETIAKGFEILSRDTRVKGVFVNIFGGIVRCDKVARGIVAAASSLRPGVPVIVRLSGSNVDEGKEILKKCDIDFHLVEDVQSARDVIASIVGKEG